MSRPAWSHPVEFRVAIIARMDRAGASVSVSERAPRVPTTERRRRWTPVSALEFVGCDSCRMTLAEYEAYPEDGRKIEFFDSEAGLAWMVSEPETLAHADAGSRLVELVHEIAMVRGSPVRCSGAGGLRLLDPDAGQVRAIHPDQMVFLHPERLDPAHRSFLRVGQDVHPDVVLEVDHTRDTRRDKLALYEEWGFPELWVEVPDAYIPSRPRGLRPEVRIYQLRGERYVESGTSRAFPGWRAEEIHEALNEPVLSAGMRAVLMRVGLALGEREGTGPDDDALLASVRTAGRAEGRAEGHAELLRAFLAARGIAPPPGFPSAEQRAALAATSEADTVAAALSADDFADFLARLGIP